MPKIDFSRRLPRPIGRFRTLACIRDRILEMPDPSPQWVHVGAVIYEAAKTGDMSDVMTALHIMRVHGGVPLRVTSATRRL